MTLITNNSNINQTLHRMLLDKDVEAKSDEGLAEQAETQEGEVQDQSYQYQSEDSTPSSVPEILGAEAVGVYEG